MSERSFGRWLVNFFGYIVAIIIVVAKVGLVIKLDLVVQKMMTIIIYLMVGIGLYFMSQYIRSHRWSKKHAKKVLGSEPMDWQRPSAFEQKLLQVGVIMLVAGVVSAITVGGSFESFIWEVVFKIHGHI